MINEKWVSEAVEELANWYSHQWPRKDGTEEPSWNPQGLWLEMERTDLGSISSIDGLRFAEVPWHSAQK